MIISTRLSLSFSAIASSIFIIFGITVYLFSSNYRTNNFQERLKERVIVTEKMFLEKETFSTEEFNKITDQFLHTLPQETEEVIEIVQNQTAIFKFDYPKVARMAFSATETHSFQDGKIQGLSRMFRVKGKDFLIIVTAVDEIGFQNLSYMKKMIIFLICLGIPFIFLGSFIITRKALLPLSKKIDHANSISATNLHQRLKVYNPKDEIGKLATAFNNLLDRLEASFDAQKAFISNASHEIKNPLTAIIGEAEVALSKSRTPEEYALALKTILEEAEKLNVTTNNLLQLSKVNAHNGEIRFESINFASFLIGIKESFDFLVPENKIILPDNLSINKSAFFILGNPELLKTSIFNILDNACKFSNNKEVKLSLIEENNSLKIKVEDSGIGIDTKDIEKVMVPFYRGNNAIQIAGSGIGLTLSSKIIELHKGNISIHSTLGEGTTIIITLPIN